MNMGSSYQKLPKEEQAKTTCPHLTWLLRNKVPQNNTLKHKDHLINRPQPESYDLHWQTQTSKRLSLIYSKLSHGHQIHPAAIKKDFKMCKSITLSKVILRDTPQEPVEETQSNRPKKSP